jgi:hypothetical protein
MKKSQLKKATLTFSLRDWKKGSEFLEKFGFNRNLVLSDTHELELEFEDIEFLDEEFSGLDLEFSFDFH